MLSEFQITLKRALFFLLQIWFQNLKCICAQFFTFAGLLLLFYSIFNRAFDKLKAKLEWPALHACQWVMEVY